MTFIFPLLLKPALSMSYQIQNWGAIFFRVAISKKEEGKNQFLCVLRFVYAVGCCLNKQYLIISNENFINVSENEDLALLLRNEIVTPSEQFSLVKSPSESLCASLQSE